MHADSATDRDVYRLILLRRRGAEVLLERDGRGWGLPRLEAASERRIAEQLTAEAKRAVQLEACWLLFTGIAGDPNPTRPNRYAVMDSGKEDGDPPPNTSWLLSTSAVIGAVVNEEDQLALESAVQDIERYVAHPRAGPFGRPGWGRELLGWVQAVVGPSRLTLTGRFSQFNASPTFSLIRIETSGPALWFKAAGEPNAHELPVTLALAEMFPSHIPELLAVHRPWNGWISREVPGSTLDEFTDVSAWKRAAKELAKLEIASTGKSAKLIESGCQDLRLPQLTAQIDPFISRMAKLMTMQVKPTPAALTDSELAFLGEELKEACSVLEAVGFPDTLGHLDFNPGNVLVSEDRCVFLDWAEGCTTHPFFTFEYLREHARRHDAGRDAIEEITASFLDVWEDFISPTDLARCLTVTPLVAIFAYVVGARGWHGKSYFENPAVAGYSRGLTRRMHREAARLQQRSERCLA